ncbi:hypothetical protein C823_002556 [Eubacterium plexicaudatum ASF492]|uniref:AMMECR1 domain-containing protein n=1 Tax=Eubacterium plexicaudatum ASF492 TaxID=1235802 RepID=N2A8A8_9FIRM|nr:hypothetical protein C823_002556 [Eubacterium plexicaudatum ASF492]
MQGKQEDAYVALARRTVEEYVRTGRQIPVPDDLPEEMYEERAGAFVSIKIKIKPAEVATDGNNYNAQSESSLRLRGCIGTIRAVQSCIAQEIIHNAVSAAVKDPRFEPIVREELDRLVISVDILGDMEPIQSEAQLDVARYGVVVTNGYRRGLLLPNLEGVDTVEEQVAIAKQKAGIGLQEDVQMERFEVVRHS